MGSMCEFPPPWPNGLKPHVPGIMDIRDEYHILEY